MRIIGGQNLPNLYDSINRCVIGSGAFVTEIFHNSNVYYMGEMREGEFVSQPHSLD